MNTIKAIIFFGKKVNLTGYTVGNCNMSTSGFTVSFLLYSPSLHQGDRIK